MKTDLASLLSALTAQPGIAAQVSGGGGVVRAVGSDAFGLALVATGAPAPVDASGKPTATPATTTATAFQAALASQAQTVSAVVQPAPIKPAAAGYVATATTALPLIAPSEIPAAQSLPVTPKVSVALAPVTVRPTIAGPATLGVPAQIPLAIPVAETPAPTAALTQSPAPAAADALQPAPLSTPTDQPATAAASKRADGKLPSKGNMLPANATPAAPRLVPQPTAVTDKGDDKTGDPANDQAASPVIVTDPGAQPLLALVIAPVQPVPPPAPTPTTAATTPPHPSAAPATATPPSPVVSIASSLAVTSGAIAPAPAASGNAAALSFASAIDPATIADGTSAAPRLTFATAQAPLVTPTPTPTPTPTAAPATPVAPLPVIGAAPLQVLAALAPVSLALPAPDADASSAAATPQPIAVALPPTAITNLAQASVTTASLSPASLSPASLSTASRLARQSGMPRSANLDASTDTRSDALSPAVGALPAAANPASATAGVASPLAAAPQDFAALVDRLLEARATAQGSTAPQQISTSVTHDDFGKVSLTFQQDTAGLSVSMTSADPGFARAAQSAIATSGQVGAGQAATADQSSAHSGNQGFASNQNPAGGFSQGFTQPDAPAPANPGTTGQSASFSTGSGGSPQSQAQAQPQQRPGFIAAANRSVAASGGAAATDADAGIFA